AGPVSVDEGTTHTYSFTASAPSGNFSVTSSSCGTAGLLESGSLVTTSTGGSFQCGFPDGPAASVVTISVEDDGYGTTASSSVSVTVVNTAPTVDVELGTVVVDEGSTAQNNGTWADAGVDMVVMTASVGAVVTGDDGTWSWSFEAADGPTESGTVTITGVDDDGAATSAEFALTVNNVAPTVALDGFTSPVEGFVLPGHTMHFSGNFTDPGYLDTHTAVWDFGDGTLVPGTLTEENDPPDATGMVSGVHTYGVPGTFVIGLEVIDDDGGAGVATITMEVMSAAGLLDLINEYIQDLPASSFNGPAAQHANALSNKLEAVKNILDNGDTMGAKNKLLNDIRAKSDGSLGGNPSNDWIVDAGAQEDLSLMIDELVAYLDRT
ncbi:PKD domain-containing protein, partial [Gemmatimonadota bacterium]